MQNLFPLLSLGVLVQGAFQRAQGPFHFLPRQRELLGAQGSIAGLGISNALGKIDRVRRRHVRGACLAAEQDARYCRGQHGSAK